jgi:hypothetical protein
MSRGHHNTKTDQRSLEAFQRAFESQGDRVNEAESLYSRLAGDKDPDKKIDALGKQTSALAATALTQIGRLWAQVAVIHHFLRPLHTSDDGVELLVGEARIRLFKTGDVELATGTASVQLKKNGDILIFGNKVHIKGAKIIQEQ